MRSLRSVAGFGVVAVVRQPVGSHRSGNRLRTARQTFASAGRLARLTELGASRVVHHGAANGHFVLLLQSLVYGYGFSGVTVPVDVPLATAIQASACVPGAFAPRVLPLERVGLTGAGRVVLVDGGVYDNMADEWEYGFASRKKSWPESVEGTSGARLHPDRRQCFRRVERTQADRQGSTASGACRRDAFEGRAVRRVHRPPSTSAGGAVPRRRCKDHSTACSPRYRRARTRSPSSSATRTESTGDRSRRADEARQHLDGLGYTPDGGRPRFERRPVCRPRWRGWVATQQRRCWSTGTC